MKSGIIVLDTLRYDVFRSEMEQTLERADHVFEQMYSTSRWTVPAHASLFTGLYPTEVGTHSGNTHLASNPPTLAEQLSTRGFQTHLFSNNVYIDSFFGFDRGFNTVTRGPHLEGRPRSSTGFNWTSLFNELEDGYLRYPKAIDRIFRSDSSTVPTLIEGLKMLTTSESETSSESTIEWVFDQFPAISNSTSDDLFMFTNLMSCHSPYNPPEEYQTVEPLLVDPFQLLLRDKPVTDEEHTRHWESYKAAARYLDDAIQHIIDAVDWDALFIISDHGELFGEHGLRQHQYGIYEELTHVPAVAVGKKIPSGTTTQMTSILDVYQTILDIAEVSAPESARGQPLFSESFDRNFVYAESVGNYRATPEASGFDEKIPINWGDPHYMYGTSNTRFVHDKDGERMLTLKKEIKPSDDTEALRAEAKNFRDNMRSPLSQVSDEELPSRIEDRLANLGYR